MRLFRSGFTVKMELLLALVGGLSLASPALAQAKPTPAEQEALVKELNRLCAEQPFQTRWHLKVLATGAVADRGGHDVVPSASTRKIAILLAALKAVHEGRLSLEQPVRIEAKYQDNHSGVFQHLRPDFSIPFRDALVMMIVVSDNTCTGAVVDLVGLDAINAFSRSIGMKGTTHRHGIPPKDLRIDHPVDATNATTAADVGLLLDLVLQGSTDAKAAARLGVTPALCQLALDILSWQKYRQRLPALLPMGTKVANKTGTGKRDYHDAGIIYQGNQALFILTVYTDQVPAELANGTPGHTAASQLISRLSRTCWDALKSKP